MKHLLWPHLALLGALSFGACHGSPATPSRPAAAEPTAAAPTVTAPAPAVVEPAAAAPAAAPEADAPPAPLEAGDPAPDVTLSLADGTAVPLASLRGSRVLVYFYPKDDTPGCTVEAKGIRDRWADLEGAGVKVFGVSLQDAESHKAFIDKYQLPFPLAMDDGSLVKAFHVPTRFGMAARQSFLVGKDGKLEHVWHAVDPATHAADVLAVVTGP